MQRDLSLYRPNVGVVLFNRDGLVWYGHRNIEIADQGQETSLVTDLLWQFPQGGVDAGEELQAAAFRELAEETGVTSASYLACTTDWHAYDFPPELLKRGKWRGQKQVWYAFRFEGDDSEIKLDQHHQIEFDAWRWGALEEAPDLIVPFKREAYRRVVEAFKPFSGVQV
jgi:putative (di)nucleoside polyphosphate hydrolase